MRPHAADAKWPHHLFLSVNLLAQCLHHHWDGICQSVMQLAVHGDVAQHEGCSVGHPRLPCRTAEMVTQPTLGYVLQRDAQMAAPHARMAQLHSKYTELRAVQIRVA